MTENAQKIEAENGRLTDKTQRLESEVAKWRNRPPSIEYKKEYITAPKCKTCDLEELKAEKEKTAQLQEKAQEQIDSSKHIRTMRELLFVLLNGLLCVFGAIRSKALAQDIISVFSIGSRGAKMLKNSIVDLPIHTALKVLIASVVVIGGCCLIVFLGIKVVQFYKTVAGDSLTLIVFVVSFVVLIFFGDLIKTVFTFNLLWWIVIAQLIYLLIRGIISMKNNR